MELFLSISIGLGLAAACGFRIFVPLLVTSGASWAGHLELASGFEWMATPAAFTVFAVATVLEIGAYYVPWLDNLLDVVAGPAAVVAGAVVAASAVAGMSPLLQWSLAVIAGGGVAATVQAATTALRQFSSWTTLGLGNPLVSTAEAGGAIGLSLLALVVPVAAIALLVVGLIVAAGLIARGPRAGAPA